MLGDVRPVGGRTRERPRRMGEHEQRGDDRVRATDGRRDDGSASGAESGEGGEVAENRRGGEAEESGLGFGVSASDTPARSIRCDCPNLRTRGLVGARELSLMKPSAYLINTSRGQIVDESALIAALRARSIAGAGLDVFDVEPLPPDHPFLSLPNTVITPHMGCVTAETYRVFYRDAVEDIRAYLAGAPIRALAG